MDKALEQLETAVELAPDVPDFRQARDLLMQRINEDSQKTSVTPGGNPSGAKAESG